MKPILFEENSTIFTTNGIGRLSDAISCEVLEERNGQYELSMVYPTSGAHYEDIKMRSIIVAKPSASHKNQPFRVYKISKPLNGKVTINAQHITYDLSKNVAMPFKVVASSTACATTLSELVNNAVEPCRFTFSTDVTTVAPYNQTTPSSIRSRLGGIEGSVLDQFGGEYEWDNFNVILHKRRGDEKNIPLRYGKNITDIKQEENISNTVTGIVPFWADNEGNVVTLPERAVYSSNASLYPQNLTIPYDFSSDYQDQPTVEQLRTHAQAYINQSGMGIPKVSIDVSFINLADTEEYKDVLPLQQVELCDIIPVQFEPLGISTTAKIVKTEYDVLAERYKQITVGSLRTNIATTIADQNNAIVTETSAKFAKVGNEIDNATSWLTSSGGYVIAVKNDDGSWKELLFLDNDDVDEAINVLRINENGIGFSSNGVAGPYTQAWTLDGRLVIGGTNVPSITVYDDNDNIIFQASADAMIWNAANSSMSDTGVITAEGANLTDANITDGSITMVGANSWLKFEDGVIYGGRGRNIGQNETSIEYDTLVNNQASNIRINGRYLFLSVDGISVCDNWGDNAGTTGYDGTLSYIEKVADIDVNVDVDTSDFAISGMLWNVSVNSDGTLSSWTVGTQYFIESVSVGVQLSGTSQSREIIHGILT